MRYLLRRLRDASGQGMAEFALAAPVVFLVLLGIVDGGRLVFINNEMSEAARESARLGPTGAARTNLRERHPYGECTARRQVGETQ